MLLNIALIITAPLLLAFVAGLLVGQRVQVVQVSAATGALDGDVLPDWHEREITIDDLFPDGEDGVPVGGADAPYGKEKLTEAG